MNINTYNTTNYENISDWTLGQSKPNSNPNKPNCQKAQMNVNSLITKDYIKYDDFAVRKNKPNSNPVLSAVEWANFRKAKMNLKSLAKKSGHTHESLVEGLLWHSYW